MNIVIWFINKFITPDDIKEMQKSLEEVDLIEEGKYPKLNEAESAMKSNAMFGQLNRNIIKLNYSTSMYSKCILFLTFIITALTVALLFTNR